MEYIWIAIFIVLVKWMFVETEYNFRHALEWRWIWGDRAIRFLLAALFIYIWFSPISDIPIIITVVLIGIYITYIGEKKRSANLFHMIISLTLEQNRMMRFYRFANYFTDVPHLKGSVSRRGWLGFLTGPQI